MAGSPKKRARREAAARAQDAAAPAAPAKRAAKRRERSASPEPDSPARTSARTTPARKAKAKARTRGMELPRFALATQADIAAVGEATERAYLAALAARNAELSVEEQTAARVERDESMVAMWALGLQPSTIAERVDLTTDHVTRVLEAHRERRATAPIPQSSDYLMDTLERLDALIERASLLASSADNESVKLGSLRTMAEMLASKLGLLQAMGRVSERPSEDARQERARDMMRSLLDALRELGVPQDKLDTAASKVFTPHAGANVVTLEARASNS